MRDLEHLGEDAELYALGGLDDLDRSRVERHVRTCDTCARRLGEAESTILRLIEDGAALDSPTRAGTTSARSTARTFIARPPAWIVAVAAAFVLGLLPWGALLIRDRGASDSVRPGSIPAPALAAMLTSHFAHVPFERRAPHAPAGKAIYARGGGWLYVIVAPGRTALGVAIVVDGRRRTVASIAPGSRTRSAFIARAGRVERVDLLERGAPVASARLVYATP